MKRQFVAGDRVVHHHNLAFGVGVVLGYASGDAVHVRYADYSYGSVNDYHYSHIDNLDLVEAEEVIDNSPLPLPG